MHPYLTELNESFIKHQDPANAAAMKKYMKGQFEYFGLKSPLRKELSKNFITKYGLPDDDFVEQIAKDCWDLPQREFQYFTMELLAKFAKKAEICRVDLYEYLALNKSWWDTIDFISSNLVGVHFKRFPDSIVPYTEKWMDSGNIWLQRVSILFQLKYRNETDVDLLNRYIERLSGSREFFINKAIGWILREYSKTNAKWVIDYVEFNKDKLATLSKREALKWLSNKNMIS